MAGFFPAPKIVDIPRDDKKPLESSLRLSMSDIHRVACFVMVRGFDPHLTAGTLGIPVDKVKQILKSQELQTHLEEIGRKPELALPTRAEAYATLRHIVLFSDKDRDRLKAAELVNDILGPPDQTASLEDLARGKRTA